ncbi:alpha/beta hydrolase [Aporhodopirellula aestuarii]|uniref:Alpha/beta hydrolase n=1 Tax=Aporhodopirellula aestuarii TaxID=2950107 RepID=A0ABT0UE72_9BACT|nr:alpha/beta hydrolase [Aporhodopirellula aestuarii]MCM2375077.1 alpha/beta hydrolase [Aporhodopirellula aestuarii]
MHDPRIANFCLRICLTWGFVLILNGGPGWCQTSDSAVFADPLFAKAEISLEDLQAGLEDPDRAASLIRNHFTRAEGLTAEQQQDFLSQALQHESWEVRQQAVEQLQRLGILQEVISEKVKSLGPRVAFSFKSALVKSRPISAPASALTDEAIATLLKDVSSQEDDKGFAAKSQIESLGLSAVPGLLQALTDKDLAPVAASALGRVIGQADAKANAIVAQTRDLGARSPAPTTRAKVRMGTVEKGEPQTLVRRFGEDQPTDVQVFFATNRQRLDPEPESNARLITGAVLVTFALVACILSVARLFFFNKDHRIGCWPIVMFVALIVLAIGGLVQFNSAWLEKYSLHEGVQFGSRRSPTSEVSYGTCHVSIPPTHQLGQVERPSVGAESEEHHVVLRSTEVMQDDEFFDSVRKLLAQKTTDGECFVFVHGYNVDFDEAARRTAQIHYDLRFSGVPMFFTWPSRGSFHHYFSDRNEILVSHEVIKQFLSDVAERSKATRIHVIAHSMGADATCRAIAELDAEGQLFEQIVLAAPDIDTTYFETNLLPKIMPKAKRTTLYCSKNDWALYASDRFNDGPRAGDSSDQVIVAVGLDTVDASDMDTELLGHSYYGSCMPLIEDVRMLLTENLSPEDRRLKAQQTAQKIPFWMFDLSDAADTEPNEEQTPPEPAPAPSSD